MSDRLVCFTVSAQAQSDADGVHVIYTPIGMTLVGVTVCAGSVDGCADGVQH